MITMEFKGKRNQAFDCIVTHLDRRKRADEQVELIEIEGRSGTLVDRYGTHHSYEREMQLANIREENVAGINKWLSGRGILRTSVDPHGYFYADIIGELTREWIGCQSHYISTTFLVEPYFYLDTGSHPIEITSSKQLSNLGTIEAEPLITVYGNGNGEIHINDKTIQLTGLTSHLTIDSRMLHVHKDGLPAGRVMSGEFPVLEEGTNIVSFSGGITRLSLTPRWREL